MQRDPFNREGTTRLTMDDALQVNDGVAIPLTEIELRASCLGAGRAARET